MGCVRSGQGRRTFDQILSYYYTGTELGDAPAALAKRLRVLIADNVPTVTLSSLVPFSVADATGTRYPLPAGDLTISPKLELPVGPLGEPVQLAGPIQFRSGSGSRSGAQMSYRGELRISSNTPRLQLVNLVPLESYLLGVVPGEMPKDWPLEALKAQAVAARTYAIGSLLKGKPYDLYSDWRSQMYYGVEHEASATTQAVRDTKGKIVTYQGKVAQVFYFSSSGGRTANAVDVYGNDVPYLVSVDDPWDVASPNHRWTPRQLTGRELAKAFGLAQPVVDVTYQPGEQGSPAQIILTTAAGVSAPFRTTDVRARLALRSSTFKLGVLRLSPPVKPAKPGAAVKVSGMARDVDEGGHRAPRDPAGTWTRVAPVACRRRHLHRDAAAHHDDDLPAVGHGVGGPRSRSRSRRRRRAPSGRSPCVPRFSSRRTASPTTTIGPPGAAVLPSPRDRARDGRAGDDSRAAPRAPSTRGRPRSSGARASPGRSPTASAGLVRQTTHSLGAVVSREPFRLRRVGRRLRSRRSASR